LSTPAGGKRFLRAYTAVCLQIHCKRLVKSLYRHALITHADKSRGGRLLSPLFVCVSVFLHDI